MFLPLRLFSGNKASLLIRFKERASSLSEAELRDLYRAARRFAPERETDLNDGCLNAILSHLVGRTVLDIGCGKGFLAGKIGATHRVTATDIVIDPPLLATYPRVRFAAGHIERLPFSGQAFDTVVCAHTLEHARDIISAIAELRRVARKRLILVVPKQRPYRYTFDLHLHFFPYESSLLALMNDGGRPNSCRDIGGDLFYVEDAADSAPGERTAVNPAQRR